MSAAMSAAMQTSRQIQKEENKNKLAALFVTKTLEIVRFYRVYGIGDDLTKKTGVPFFDVKPNEELEIFRAESVEGSVTLVGKISLKNKTPESVGIWGTTEESAEWSRISVETLELDFQENADNIQASINLDLASYELKDGKYGTPDILWTHYSAVAPVILRASYQEDLELDLILSLDIPAEYSNKILNEHIVDPANLDENAVWGVSNIPAVHE